VIPGRALAAILLCVAAAGGIGFGGYTLGYSRAAETAREQQERADAAAREALDQANARTEAKEREHEQALSDLRAGFVAERAKAEADADRRRRALVNGSERLRFAVRSCAADRTVAAAAAASASGADGGAEADLDPEVAAAIVGLTDEGDSAIRQLTALQTWAVEAVRLCNQ